MKGLTQQQGMTLIELMVVVAIIGIISAIAYPSYTRYVQDTRRTLVQGEMLEYAQSMERFFTANTTYTGAALPFNRSPRSGSDIYYNLGLAASGATYTITATPSGGQGNDECGVMTINHIGSKGAANNDCWRN
ncbi:MAG: type IV pilin protein [Pseudomonadales bacterium]